MALSMPLGWYISSMSLMVFSSGIDIVPVVAGDLLVIIGVPHAAASNKLQLVTYGLVK